MSYFFVLGNNATLSLAELSAVWPLRDPQLLAPDLLLADGAWEMDAGALMKRLGGVIKIARVAAELPLSDIGRLEKTLADLLFTRQGSAGSGKFNFGFSVYGERSFDCIKYGQQIKKRFAAAGISTRFVVSKEKTLSSVVVTQNKLLSRGQEIILTVAGDKIVIGETLAVQPFKDLSRRDYGRPARDDRSGMLPPKLALAMINLAQLADTQAVICDPFCGSGTIISEAVLQGYKNLFASDISPEAIKNTKQNISWIKELYRLEDFRLKIFLGRAEKLTKVIKPLSLEAIITEPYLGPQRGRIDFAAVIASLESLYAAALQEFKRALKPGGRVVMVWPSYYGQRPISPDYSGFKILNLIPPDLRTHKFIKLSQRETIIYGRPGQKVFREIVVLEKI